MGGLENLICTSTPKTGPMVTDRLRAEASRPVKRANAVNFRGSHETVEDSEVGGSEPTVIDADGGIDGEGCRRHRQWVGGNRSDDGNGSSIICFLILMPVIQNPHACTYRRPPSSTVIDTGESAIDIDADPESQSAVHTSPSSRILVFASTAPPTPGSMDARSRSQHSTPFRSSPSLLAP